MGYYTRYKGSVSGRSPFINEFIEDATNREQPHEGSKWFTLSDWLNDFDDVDSMSWYSHEEDVEALSKKYPYLLFELEGEGEESADIWKLWARSGKSIKVQAEVTFPEVDVDKELPTPDIEEALAQKRAEKRAEIDAEIERLRKERDALDS